MPSYSTGNGFAAGDSGARRTQWVQATDAYGRTMWRNTETGQLFQGNMVSPGAVHTIPVGNQNFVPPTAAPYQQAAPWGAPGGATRVPGSPGPFRIPMGNDGK